MSVCRIADYYFDAITQAPRYPAIVRVAYLDDVVILRAGGELAHHPTNISTNTTGFFSFDAVWGTLCDPLDAPLEIRFDDGTRWVGAVPPVEGPVSLEELAADYGWLPAGKGTPRYFDVIGLRARAWLGLTYLYVSPAGPSSRIERRAQAWLGLRW